MGRGELVLGYAHGGTIRNEFHVSALKFQRHDFFNAQILANFSSAGGCLLEDNREAVVEGFLGMSPQRFHFPPEWLVSLDTDIRFDPDDIYRLLEIADPVERPIVSALYYTTIESSFTACWLRKNPDDNDYKTLAGKMVGLNQIDGCGMGCCIIHRSVLEKVGAKYAEEPFKWFGRDRIQKKGGIWTRLGEDISFCRRAQSVGATIWGTVDVRVGHYKIREENADTMKERVYAMQYRSLLEQNEALMAENARKAAVEEFYGTRPQMPILDGREHVRAAGNGNGAIYCATHECWEYEYLPSKTTNGLAPNA
jgi:hypothetical protein